MDIFIKNIVDILKAEVPLSEEEIKGLIEIPPDLKMGDFAFPCFFLASKLKSNPNEISKNIVQNIGKLSESKEFETNLSPEDLPDSINDVEKDITQKIIECSTCKKAYKIMPAELQFLQVEQIPLPRTCVDCRHKTRILFRNKNELYKRKCADC